MKTVYHIAPDTNEKVSLEGYSPLMQKLLHQRGIFDIQHAESFCKPDYKKISDPYMLHDMGKALERIYLALKNKEKITIYADYDADGIPAAVILYDTFIKIGHSNIEVYIPHRHDEGFGLHIPALTKIAEGGTSLIITVDLGTSAVAEVLHAQMLGIDSIITDHHLPGETLPNAIALVNPKLGKYPDPMLCASAVAFQLVRGLLHELSVREPILGIALPLAGYEKWLLDLVGIATISDMVPLRNENRIFAYYGLKVLRKTKRLGLRTLIQKLGITLPYITETDIGFSLTPRINAASRMDHPMRAFELLIATDPVVAQNTATYLMKKNEERKTQVATSMRALHKKLGQVTLRDILVTGDSTWGHGILGLIAGKVTEHYKVSTFVYTEHHDGTLKGSCRGYGSVDVTQLMALLPADTFVQFGGHAGAGGFTIARDKIHFLEDLLCDALLQLRTSASEGNTDESIITQSIAVDALVCPDDITESLYRDTRQLAPFGMDNPEPVFGMKGIVEQVKSFGKGNAHLEIVFQKSHGRVVRGIAWYTAPESLSYIPELGQEAILIGTLEESRFMGKKELRLKILDLVQSLNE